MSDLKTIRLYGKLGTEFGREHKFAVRSAAEAVQALCAMYPNFEKRLMESKDTGVTFAVFNGKRNLKEENLRDPCGNEDIRIAPVLIGSKRQGVLQTILGIVLIVVGVVMNVWAPGSGVGVIQMGIAMVAGGVIQMLSPTPKGPDGLDKPDDNASYVFNGPVNTQAQGNPVPLLYGRMKVGSSVISAGIVANQEVFVKPARPVYGGGGVSDIIAYIIASHRYDQEYADEY